MIGTLSVSGNRPMHSSKPAIAGNAHWRFGLDFTDHYKAYEDLAARGLALLCRKHGRTLPFENSVPDVELGYGCFNGRVQALARFEQSRKQGPKPIVHGVLEILLAAEVSLGRQN